MAGVENRWTETTAEFAGHNVHQMQLNGRPGLTLLEFRLHGGGVRGGNVPLGRLWDNNETIISWGMEPDGSGTVSYDRAALLASLQAVFGKSGVTEILTLNPDTVPFIEHPDHIYTARITRQAAQSYGVNLPISYHTTYPTASFAKNVAPSVIQKKRDSAATYFALDGGGWSAVFGEYRWDGDWVARHYAFNATTNSNLPNVQTPSFNLLNEYSSQCLTAGGSGKSPYLMGCSGAATQNWHWQPSGVPAGNRHSALLVNDASQSCIAERNGLLFEEPCAPSSNVQRWTPWDFGIVYTPQDNCLVGQDGTLVSKACSNLTAESRWAMKRYSQWTDTRQQAAMYADVRGNGESSPVYVHRRGDGPGFNVWVSGARQDAPAALWFENAVPFDSAATTPSCKANDLCFDATRFLLADFDGDGKADLMAVKPGALGSTTFWVMRSTGTGFARPVLWGQTNGDWTPDEADQYVAADFEGDGRADVMIAHQRGDSGLDLWVMTSNGVTGNAPELWSDARSLSPSTHFFPARVAGSTYRGLLAVQSISNRVNVTQFRNNGHAFQLAESTATELVASSSKVVSGDLDGDGVDDLLALHMRGDGPDINVWYMKGGMRFGALSQIGRLSDSSWADTFPGLARHADGTHTLTLFTRENVVLDNIHFTAGGIKLLGYELPTSLNLQPLRRLGDAPGIFSEALWVERLSN